MSGLTGWPAPRPRAYGWDRLILVAAFVFLVLPLGLRLVFVTPPGQVADETGHIVREEALLHGGLIGVRHFVPGADGTPMAVAGAKANVGLMHACLFPGDSIGARAIAAKARSVWLPARVFLEITPLAVYFPVFYVPAAFGIGLAHAAGMLPFQAILAGRLVSLLCFGAAGVFSLLLARRGQALIFLALSMPMTVSLAASCCQDGLLIASAALGCAAVSRGGWRLAAVCLGAVIWVKPPYGLLAGLLLGARPRALRPWLVAFVVVPGALWFAYGNAFVAAAIPQPAYHPGPLWPGGGGIVLHDTDPAAQLRVVLAHPAAAIGLVWQDLRTNTDLPHEMIGWLGWLTIPLPPALYTIWMAAACGAVVCDLLGRRDGVPVWVLPLALLLIAATITLIWLSQYLTWTPVGLTVIYGPTGRYLLPLIPVLGLGLPRFGAGWTVWLRGAALALPVGAAAVSLVWVPAVVKAYFGG